MLPLGYRGEAGAPNRAARSGLERTPHDGADWGRAAHARSPSACSTWSRRSRPVACSRTATSPSGSDSRAPRAVGTTLARFGGGVPWWRVVRAGGFLAPGHEVSATEHLRAEGVEVLPGAERPTRGPRPPPLDGRQTDLAPPSAAARSSPTGSASDLPSAPSTRNRSKPGRTTGRGDRQDGPAKPQPSSGLGRGQVEVVGRLVERQQPAPDSSSSRTNALLPRDRLLAEGAGRAAPARLATSRTVLVPRRSAGGTRPSGSRAP